MAKPFHTIRDRLIKVTIWKNITNEKKIFYSVDIARAYKTSQGWNDTNSFSGAELLKAANLISEAYNFIRIQEAADRDMQRASSAEHPANPPPADTDELEDEIPY